MRITDIFNRITTKLRLTTKPRLLICAGVCSFVFLASLYGVSELISTYFFYSAMVDARLADHSFMYPAGIYAAPGRVSRGQRITQNDLVERLVRVGYQEGEDPSEFTVGSYSLKADTVEIRTSPFAAGENLPASLRISFKNNEVARIEDGESHQEASTVFLPAQMLTEDINAKKQTRRPTSYEELPSNLVNALLSIEDRRFYEHSGVDVTGIARALYTNFVHGKIEQGGSTITQQLMKDQFLSSERTYRRKLAEAMMSIAIERRLSKQQILALYCDRVYLGHSGNVSIYGFKQAAMTLFGKSLSDLSLSEAACLAGLAQAPNRYSLHSSLDNAISRRNTVLDAMLESKKISDAEASAAKEEQLAILPPQKLDDTSAPYFVDYLKRELGRSEFKDEEWPQLRIETTLDVDLQQAANQAISKHLNRSKKSSAEAALIAIDPHSGEILAMVGGRDYATSQLNRATDASRQPGSVFKPIVYAAALSRGLSPAMTFTNSPQKFQYSYNAVYKPENFHQSYSYQQVTLREAIVRSLNVVAVQAAMQTGLDRVADMADRVGLPRPDLYPSMALGAFEATPLDIARAYTVFADDGNRVDPLAISSIKSNGEVLKTCAASKSMVLTPSVAYLVTDTLTDVVNRGTAARVRSLGYRGPAAGKTGTSRDAWFVGYTPKLLVVVWVGNDDNHDLGLTGGDAAVPIWTAFVKRALELRPDLAATRFPLPSGLQTVEIDSDNGLLATEFCPHRQKILVSYSLIPPACIEHSGSFTASQYEGVDPDGELPTGETSPHVDLPLVSVLEMKPVSSDMQKSSLLLPRRIP